MPKAPKGRKLTCRSCLYPQKPRYRDSAPQSKRLQFSTPDKLDEHLKAEHSSSMYECNAIGCFKGTSTTRFQKTETLTQHIKESHGPDSMFSCPENTCNFGPAKLDEMVVHIHWTHTGNIDLLRLTTQKWQDWRHTKRAVRAVMNSAPWLYLMCPVWNCQKSISGGYDKAKAHLLGHSVDQLDCIREKLAEHGYEIQLHPNVGAGPDIRHTKSIHVKCPACKVCCEDDESFRRHLENDHLLAFGAADHFLTWRRDVKSKVCRDFHSRFDRHPCWIGAEGFRRRRVAHTVGKFVGCSFPSCSFVEPQEEDKHPSFLRAAEETKAELGPCRMEILRHYPDFLDHPLFEESSPPRGDLSR